MTPKEALKIITSTPKWYTHVGEESESYYRVTALRILNGTAHSFAMKKFFDHFGYEYKSEVIKK